jgi:signal transduction histidine kinase
MEALFHRAEEIVSQFFSERRDDPTRGTIEIFGERYVLVRAASMSVEFFRVVNDLYGAGRRAEADAFARNILYDLAHALGKSDARNFHAKMSLEDPIARLSAGPVHFAYSGWAFVDISPESAPTPDESYYLVYDHPYSFESDAWLRAGGARDFPVCIMNAGYSAGWCEESFGVKLVSSEILCRARHDESCRFIMAHPDRIEEHVARYVAAKPHLASRVRGHQVPDLFARKRMEEELRRSHADLERRIEGRTSELRASNERLLREMAERELVEKKLRQAHKLEAIALLAGGVAHDFNNLIAVMLTRAGLLERRLPPGDPARDELEQIRKAAERAALLTKKLLAFGRVQVVQRQVVDVHAVLADLWGTLVPLIGEDIVLERRLARAPDGAPVGATGPTIEADRAQMEQVIMNLILNARDAMPRGGRLLVETDRVELAEPLAVTTGVLRGGAYVSLAVEDQGIGMDEETMSRIFDPFFTTKGEGRGTGLGLSTVYGILQQAKGAIAVSSTVGRGTRFCLYFPALERAEQDVVPTSRIAARGGSETILVVEDQVDLGAAIRDSLTACGYRVLLANNPERALDIALVGAQPIDLLVTDVVMPHMSGAELADQIVRARPGIRLLFISGYAPDSAFRKGIFEQTAAFLPKPFLPEELARKVREVLDAPPPAPGQAG